VKKLAVIALGGNALLRDNQYGTIEEQEQNTKDTLENIVYLLREDYNLILTHGNGPQVGNILMQNDAGESLYNIAQMPLDICVADSQGSIGYMIERILRNVLKDNHMQKEVISLVSQVEVNQNDPGFNIPVKRIGKIYSREEADRLAQEKKWVFKEDPKKEDGWRRAVPSPKPVSILNRNIIEQLSRQGNIVIAAGGGGIPVYIDENKNVRPAEVVIDKDLASALLATSVSADELYILTDVPYVYLNYKKPGQQVIEFLSVNDARKLLNKGMFGEGSMAPKINAAINFVNAGGQKAIITEATKLEDTDYGTKITAEYDMTDFKRKYIKPFVFD
jgi:carbamate kinase